MYSSNTEVIYSLAPRLFLFCLLVQQAIDMWSGRGQFIDYSGDLSDSMVVYRQIVPVSCTLKPLSYIYGAT